MQDSQIIITYLHIYIFVIHILNIYIILEDHDSKYVYDTVKTRKRRKFR